MVTGDPAETHTRFIKDRNLRPRQYPDGGYYAVVGVFMPRPGDDERMELSTFGIDRLDDDQTWSLGFDYFLPPGRQLKGRADLRARRFLAADLTFLPQQPPPRHGSFIGWPDEETKRQVIATAFAAEATAHPHPLGADAPRRP